ncbi:UDP-N-acetylglucosamine 2-epimerase [Amphibacillus sediminis]|uniref:UDP-N-acetylglucosamine 2-epimerase n=1 Tax=Amphibacillus sediminis TaxID=360185 RepID=UPI00082D5677|nr:UDP-N-acetylglucosamine 2-epimerase [Amphibacillus sediminis]
MINIAILTATRSEYGLLKPLILRIKEDPDFKLNLIVTGAHLSPEFGLTYKEIENDGFDIDKKVEMLLSADSPASISKSMGLALIGFADYFTEQKPDLLIVLGDRYETLAVALAAMNQKIPIAHLYGGETTEGAIDESIRHVLTKLSYFHFTSTKEYRERVIQLGEDPKRVKVVGGLGIENIKQERLLPKEEFTKYVGIDNDKPYVMVTYHPVTLENNQSSEIQINELLKAINKYPEINFLITKANADAHGRIINQKIDEYVTKHTHAKSFTSLGMQRYLSGLKYSSLVLGNSSSGILEAPSFGIPTVNIGDRQKGRIQAESIINCSPISSSIEQAIKKALSPKYIKCAARAVNPYGDGNTSKKIIEFLKEFGELKNINLKKSFYDLGVKDE